MRRRLPFVETMMKATPTQLWPESSIDWWGEFRDLFVPPFRNIIEPLRLQPVENIAPQFKRNGFLFFFFLSAACDFRRLRTPGRAISDAAPPLFASSMSGTPSVGWFTADELIKFVTAAHVTTGRPHLSSVERWNLSGTTPLQHFPRWYHPTLLVKGRGGVVLTK